MADKVYSGGCDCGAVKIKATTEPVFSAVCHCLNCQHSSGSGHNFFVVFPSDKVEITGKTSVYNYKADSGNTASSHFCPTCGSQLYGLTTGFPGMVGVRVACFEDSSDLKPQVEVYTKRLQAWDTLTEGIPSFPAMPPMNAAAQ
jgi:hypothetical protein